MQNSDLLIHATYRPEITWKREYNIETRNTPPPPKKKILLMIKIRSGIESKVQVYSGN